MNPAISSLTCLTCRVLFPCENGDLVKMSDTHKAHFQSDWHRFNLNRKISNLPPVSFDIFNERILLKQNEALKTEPTSWYCEMCKKKFSSSKTFEDHNKSNKHIQMEKSQPKLTEIERMNKLNLEKSRIPPSLNVNNDDSDEDLEVEEVSDDEWESEPLPVNVCLFCSQENKDMDANIEHMNRKHGLFIPDIEYVSDLNGLMSYLGEKVGSYHVCLWCNNNKGFHDVRAVQMHMSDKGHCKINTEADAMLEFADFYDYRKSYPDYKPDGDGDDEEEMESADTSVVDLDDHNFQLKLPSGATIGHRFLFKYYKQKLRPDRQIVLHNNSSSVARAISHYKKLGWTGTSGSAALVKAKDMAYLHKLKSKQFVNLGVKSNKLQRHFRDQNFGF